MENLKIGDVEHTSNVDYTCDEKDTCLLEESDTQCGYVFYNEFTRLLKFYCTYCRETYDNIQYFCQHLSDHVNESNGNMYAEVDSNVLKKDVFGIDAVANIEATEDMSPIFLKDKGHIEINSYPSPQKSDEDTRDACEYNHHLEELYSINGNIDKDETVDHLNEMFVEDIKYSVELGSEIHQEISKQMYESGTNTLFPPETGSSTDATNYDEKSSNPIPEKNRLIDNTKSGNSFEECFIKETNIDKIRSEGVCVLKEKSYKNRNTLQKKRTNIQDLLRIKRRRRKVTTVKVIAVKNRIAELYEKIQNEQQKSQKNFLSDFSNAKQEHEAQDAIEHLINDEVDTNNLDIVNKSQIGTNDRSNHLSEVSRKIIGETLITLIPEGTKIPDKMPSPVNSISDNEQLPVTNNFSYNHKKADVQKDKMAICPACGKTFRSHFSLTIHKRIHYLESDSSVKLAHKCSDCDQLFNKLSQLKHHVETVHYPEGFICKICDRQLSSLSLLERHMVKVHLDRPFNCKKCNKNFSDHITFEEHLASHNSGEVFKCTTCGRKYSTEYFLIEHMRNHKEQVPQTCVVCGKVTLRITQHMKIHTPRPKRLLSCSECGKVFNFSSGLSHHFKIMHKLPRPPPKLKKDTHVNSFKRKRRSRTEECIINKKKYLPNSSSAGSTFVIDNEKLPDQIIEEQIDISHEAYSNRTNLEIKNNPITEEPATVQDSGHTHTISNIRDHNPVVIQKCQKHDVINHKEEEAKRVIVELIQNSTFTSFFPDNLCSVLEITPPIAREETISAVNSIVHES